MRIQQINRVSGIIVIVLSLIALLAVLSGYSQPPQPDEGTAAHIFQLAIVVLVPITVLFLATADWKQPGYLLLEIGTKAFVLRSIRCGRLMCSASFDSAIARAPTFL